MTTEPRKGEDTRLARKAVRARSLIDPLGAKGFRRASERIEKEARARRLAFVAALASFAGIFGLIVATAEETPAPSLTATAKTQQVIAEVPIPSENPFEPPTIVRIIAPEQVIVPDVRTRAS